MARLIPKLEQTEKPAEMREDTLNASRDARNARIAQLMDRAPKAKDSDKNSLIAQVRTEKNLTQADQRAALNAALRAMENDTAVATATRKQLA